MGRHLNTNWVRGKSVADGDLDAWAEHIRQGNRGALSKAITLAESMKEADQEKAAQLLLKLPVTFQSKRIGLTGIPGAGKSTFIEALGMEWINRGEKLAVLAVDPSSQVSGGAILGDKTRMEFLARHESAFIRPSPSSGELGGVTRATRAVIQLLEAAGYNHILVETVGVGQSETEVFNLTDMFILLAIPGAGDELQGIKRGIMEMADLVVVNKADGGNQEKARQAAIQLENALHLFPPGGKPWTPKVLVCSALEKKGISDVYETIQRYFSACEESGYLAFARKEQERKGLQQLMEQEMIRFMEKNTDFSAWKSELMLRVEMREITLWEAVQQLNEWMRTRM